MTFSLVTDPGPLVSQNKLQHIHETALRLLSHVGIRTDHAGMREKLRDAGCRVEGERVYISPELVAATLQDIPHDFTVYGRSTQDSIVVGLNAMYLTNTGIFPYIYDLERGEIRCTSLNDVATTTRLLDAMEHIDAVYVSLVDATDLEPHMVTVSDFAAVLSNTTKPLIGPGVANRAEAETVVRIARTVRGGDEGWLSRYPVCVPFVCPVSPLFFPKDVVEALMVVCEAGLPLDTLSNPVAGLTAPYTVASAVAVGHAEVLACGVMAHAVTPGLPILFQNTPSVADMRSLASTTGGPETGLIRHTAAALSRFLGIPSCAHGHTSSAWSDWQAGDEKALNSLLIASAQPALLGGLGALANVTLTSFETILLDNERYGALKRIRDGVRVDEDHLAFDVIAHLVNTGSVLTHSHTRRHLSSGEFWHPQLAVRQGLIGSVPPQETSVTRARDQARALLDCYAVEPLAESVQKEINELLDTHRFGHDVHHD